MASEAGVGDPRNPESCNMSNDGDPRRLVPNLMMKQVMMQETTVMQGISSGCMRETIWFGISCSLRSHA